MAKRSRTGDELLYELLWKNHNALDPKLVISTVKTDDGGMYVTMGGKRVPDVQLANFQSEAKMIEGTTLWKSIVSTLEGAAQDSIFKASKNVEDVHYGKTMLLNLSVIENIFRVIQRPNLNKNPTVAAAHTRYPKK